MRGCRITIIYLQNNCTNGTNVVNLQTKENEE